MGKDGVSHAAVPTHARTTMPSRVVAPTMRGRRYDVIRLPGEHYAGAYERVTMHLLNKPISFLLAAVVAVGLLVQASVTTQARGRLDRPGQGSPSGNLTVAYDFSLTTGDPDKTGQPGDMGLLINIFDPLTQRGPDGKLRPSLATSWHLVNKFTWRFELRKNVKFQDGEPFNANVVKYSIDRVLDPSFASPVQELHDVSAVKVVSKYAVDIVTQTPDPLIPSKVALFGGMMVPPKYIAQKGEAYFAAHPVGTGPYKVSSWVRDDHLTLKAYTHYWGPKPHVKQVTVRFIIDPTTRVSALLSGQVDLATAIPPTSVRAIKSSSGLRLDRSPGLRIYYISIANTTGPLSKAKVRQALSYAVNTKLLIKKLMLGYARPIAAPVAQTNYGSHVSLKPYPYSPAKARKLLAAAGYKHGFTVAFDTETGIYQTIAQVVAQMWANVGVHATINVLPTTEYVDKYANGTLAPVWNLGYTIWQGDPTTLIQTFFHSGLPRARYFNPSLDQEINHVASQNRPKKRLKLMYSVLKQLHDAAPWIYLMQANDLYGVAKRVHWTVPAGEVLRFDSVSVR